MAQSSYFKQGYFCSFYKYSWILYVIYYYDQLIDTIVRFNCSVLFFFVLWKKCPYSVSVKSWHSGRVITCTNKGFMREPINYPVCGRPCIRHLYMVHRCTFFSVFFSLDVYCISPGISVVCWLETGRYLWCPSIWLYFGVRFFFRKTYFGYNIVRVIKVVHNDSCTCGIRSEIDFEWY